MRDIRFALEVQKSIYIGVGEKKDSKDLQACYGANILVLTEWLLVVFTGTKTFFTMEILGSTAKPEDMYRIVEHFALGRRRLELFGEDHNIRPGWLTVGGGLSSSDFNSEVCLPLFLFF